MKRYVVAAAGLWWGLQVFGCNATTVAADAGIDAGYALPSNPLSPLQACLEIATAEANFEVACHRLAPSDVGDASSGYIGAQCPAALLADAEADFQANKLAYSGDAVSCVVNALVNQGSRPRVSCNTGYPQLDPACGQLGWGTLGPGQSCSEIYGCAVGYFCQVQPGSACGVCALDAQEGNSCGNAASGAICSSGVCNGSECRPLVGLNQGCSEGTAVCSLPFTCHELGCLAPLGLDGGCATDVDCASGLSCNVFASRCVSAPTDGGDCSEQSCSAGFACLSSDAGFSCAPLVPGGPCIATDAGLACPEFESCRAGNCVPLSPFDGGCGVPADCAVGSCLGGICQLLPDGDRCTMPFACQSNVCDVSVSGKCIAACGATGPS